MPEASELLPLEDALAAVDAALAGASPEAEMLPVRQALGRVLARPQRSLLDQPPFDKSAMDGFAVLAGDERAEYRLLETVAAGQVAASRLSPGATIKVMTGAPLPAGTGRVIMQEDTEQAGDMVHVTRRQGADNICRRGEDVRAGDVIMPAGRTLNVPDVANLVACGVTEAPVFRRPRLAIICTGDEIVDAPELLAAGKIMNANGPLLAGLAVQSGLAVVCEETVPDEPARVAAAISQTLASADIVALSGGVSVGEFDCAVDAIASAGLPVRFHGVAIKPGKPVMFAGTSGKALFGLPGNPVSVYVTFRLFVQRAAALMAGAAPAPALPLRLPMAAAWRRRKAERAEFVPCRVLPDTTIEALEFHGSAHLLALSHADGLFMAPAGVKELAAGERAGFMPLERPRCRIASDAR